MAAPTDSNVNLCNRVITRLGSTDTISALSNDRRNARILNANFEFLRDALNASHPWNWAIKRSTLAVDAGETPNHEFTNSFTMPTDWMDLVRDADAANGIFEDFRIEGDFYVTNQSTVKIEYVARIEDLNKWSIWAREALVALLLATCGPAIRDNLSAATVREFYGMFQENWMLAKSIDGQNGKPREFVTDKWLSSRLSFQGDYSGLYYD